MDDKNPQNSIEPKSAQEDPQTSEAKWYPPSHDVVFKLLWRRSLKLLSAFESLIVKDLSREELESINFIDTEQQISPDTKQTRLDIKTRTESGVVINTEMQNDRRKSYRIRILIYLSQALLLNNETLKYEDYKRVINISILNYKEFDDDNAIHHCTFCDVNDGKVFVNIMDVYTFEVNKAAKNDVSDPLTAWGLFFASKTKEEAMYAATLDPSVAEAFEALKFLNLDKKTRMLIAEMDLEKRDRIDEIESARDEGREETAIVIAKNLLAINEPVAKIASVTNLPISTVEKLKSGN